LVQQFPITTPVFWLINYCFFCFKFKGEGNKEEEV
jgi:hypothetical protein